MFEFAGRDEELPVVSDESWPEEMEENAPERMRLLATLAAWGGESVPAAWLEVSQEEFQLWERWYDSPDQLTETTRVLVDTGMILRDSDGGFFLTSYWVESLRSHLSTSARRKALRRAEEITDQLAKKGQAGVQKLRDALQEERNHLRGNDDAT